MPDITINAHDRGSFSAYMAKPAETPAPGLVVIQEIFGVNQVMRDLCDGFAAMGYVAVCPDLFWRQKPNVQLTDKTKAEWEQAFGYMQGFDIDLGVEDLATTLGHLRGLPDCTGKVGDVGYCLGGKLAFLMACRTDADASVSYYGVALDQHLKEAGDIDAPVLLHVAEKDGFVPPDVQKRVADGLAGNSHVTIHTYPGQDHAFAREGGEHYDPEAAKLANDRTAAFFAEHLVG